MKFNFCVGNPPYQIETLKKDSDCQPVFTNVFQNFQTEVERIANVTCLIYPAKRWIFGTGKGCKAFGHNQINDPHLMALRVYDDASDCFHGITVHDGMSVVIKNLERERESNLITIM